MTRTRKNIPTEDELLAYIEGDLSDEQAHVLFEHLEGQEKARHGLTKLRADKEALCSLVDPDPPADLLDDCLTAVERSLLVADDPIAPAFEFPRRRQGAWRKYAAAASFFIIAAIGGVLILRSINFKPVMPEFVAGNGTAESKESTSAGTADDPGTSDQTVERTTDSTPPDASNRLAANESAQVGEPKLAGDSTAGADSVDGGEASIDVQGSNADDENNRARAERFARVPPLRDHAPIVSTNQRQNSDSTAHNEFADPNPGSTDPGLGVRLAALDREPALSRLRELVNQYTGTTLIYNTPLRDTLPTNLDPDELETLNWTSAGNSEPSPRGARSPANPNAPLRQNRQQSNDTNAAGRNQRFDESHLVILPLDLQHSYRDGGYEYTLVGKPSQLHAILRQMNSSTDVGAVRVLRRNATARADNRTESIPTVYSLADLLPPPRPVGKDWARALFWWTDPERNLPISSRLAESFKPEPIVRLPIRIVGR